MKLLFACVFALCLVFSFAQEESYLRDQMTTYGTGVVLVPINRAAITITALGSGATATDAVNSATNLQRQMNSTLSNNYTIYDVRAGGLILLPVYEGSVLSFSARVSLSVVVPFADMARLLDAMIGLGASNISFMLIPDFTAVELAQSQALRLAVVDGLWKAQAVLDTIHHCARNITRIEIMNPSLELPSITFNLWANMGNNLNQGMLNNAMSSPSVPNAGNSNSNNNLRQQSNVLMLGAGAPFIEGDREEIIAYVRLSLGHAACGSENDLITDLRSGLDMSNLVGFSGGIFEITSPTSPTSPSSPISSPVNHRRRAW